MRHPLTSAVTLGELLPHSLSVLSVKQITIVPTSWRVGAGICQDGTGLAQRKRSIKGGYDSRMC